MKYLNLLLLFSILSLWSCDKDETENEQPLPDSEVYYISNEGAFGFGNASVSLYYPAEKKMINDAFRNANNRRPGDVLQSISKVNTKLYLMVNASNKIEITEEKTLKELGVIQDIKMPRYLLSSDGKTAFASSWSGGSKGHIVVLDLNTNKLIDSITVGKGPEKMLINPRANNNLVVCNSGGFSNDSTLSIIDTHTRKLIYTKAVAHNPIDLVLETNGFWVLCKGKIIYDANFNIIGHTPSYLQHLTDNGQSINKSVRLFDEMHPAQLEISPDNRYLYVGGGYGFKGIYRYNIGSGNLDSLPLIDKDFYGFNVDPQNGDLYGFEAPTFTVSGKMYHYSKEGKLIEEYSLGVGPNGITF
jgi:DNA-binding beta-propeller fold protein YncE